MTEKQLSGAESLELIARMIKNTQNKMIANQGFPFILWGYSIAATSLIVWWLMRSTGSPAWNFLWFAPSLICYPIVAVYTKRQQRQSGVTTFVDKVIGYIWCSFGFMGLAATAGMFLGYAFPEAAGGVVVPIFYTMTVLVGGSILLTGLVSKLKVLTVCGALTLLISFAFLFVRSMNLYLMFALMIIVVMAIPGHAMNAMARKMAKKE